MGAPQDDNVPNRYNRLTAKELSAALDDLKLTAGQFARLSGSQRKRVLQWLEGIEEIPHNVTVLLSLLKLPGSMKVALDITDEMIIEEEPQA